MVSGFILVIIIILFFVDSTIEDYSTNERRIPDSIIYTIRFNHYKGYGISIVLKINSIEKRRRYIVDIGEDLNTSRISILFDNENNLIFRIIDSKSKIHSVNITDKIHSLQLATFYCFYFDYGYTDEYSFMRVYINDKLLGDRFFEYNQNLPKKINNEWITWFSDMRKEYSGNFTTFHMATLKETLTEVEINKHMNSVFNLLRRLGKIPN
jgi:hypothetical protein